MWARVEMHAIFLNEIELKYWAASSHGPESAAESAHSKVRQRHCRTKAPPLERLRISFIQDLTPVFF